MDTGKEDAGSCFSGAMGTCPSEKLQRILASALFSQHAKLNMATFALYLLVCFALRCRMVELHPKSKKIEFPAGNIERQAARHGYPKPTPKPKTLYHRGHRKR
jgi:hypothetical protein